MLGVLTVSVLGFLFVEHLATRELLDLGRKSNSSASDLVPHVVFTAAAAANQPEARDEFFIFPAEHICCFYTRTC